MKRSEILFGILRVPVDALMCLGALLLAYHLRAANIDLLPNVQLLSMPVDLPIFAYYLERFALPATGLFLVLAATLQLYSLTMTLGPWREMGRVLGAAALWLALIIAWFFLIQKQLFFSRILLIQATVFLALFAILGRTIVLMVQRWCLRRGVGIRTVLSCGTIPLPASVADGLSADVRYRFAGHAESTAQALTCLKDHPIDLVLHTDPNPSSGETSQLIDYCRSHQIGYAFLPPVFADVPHLLSVSSLGFTPILRFEPTPLDGWGRVWKRAVDLAAGLILLIVLSPFLLLITLAILVTSGLPVLYVSRRVGQFGKGTVPVLKFRTMCRDADTRKDAFKHLSHRTDGPLFKVKDDPRVTPLGRLLRRFSLDELPQLLNVIAGHLSLVGPRPHLPDEVARYSQWQRRVFTVRPGVTGLAQISGRSGLSFEDEVRLDLKYIEDWSLGLDLWIVWRTVFVVLSGREAD